MNNYHAALDDPELLTLRDELALIDARLSDVLSRVDTGEAGRAWKEARDAFDRFSDATRSRDRASAASAMRDLGRLLGAGLTDYAAWNEIGTLIEQRRKLAESEQKRLIAAQQMITSEQAMTFVAALLNVVKDAVTDRQTLNKIQNGVNDLLNRSETRVPANVG